MFCWFYSSNTFGEFVENKGQWHSQVLFQHKLNQGAVFISQNEITWYFYELPFSHLASTYDSSKIVFKNLPNELGPTDPGFSCRIRAHAFKLKFEGASSHSKTTGRLPYSHYSNYFYGNNQKSWATNVKSFEKIYIENLYEGIDMEIFISEGQQLKYNFILKAGADFSSIKMKYEGADSVFIKKQKLHIQTSIKNLIEDIPLAYYQDGQGETFKVSYQLNNNIVSFSIPDYHSTRPSVIDPKVIFSSYSGSTADNWGFTATYDILGHTYSGGIVFDPGFPTTIGAFQTTFAGGVDVEYLNGDVSRDIGILKYTPDGKQLIYATYLGGSHNEQPHSMVVNNAGLLCILGTTYSKDFPGMNASSYQPNHAGESDLYITQFSSDGTKLVHSTFIGGKKRDGLNGTLNKDDQNTSSLGWNYGDIFRGEIICDSFDNIYISSCTQSTQADGLPLVKGQWNTYGGGDFDGYIAKFNPSLSTLMWSSYIGGSKNDAAYGIYIYNQELYVCGGTESNDCRLNAAVNIKRYQNIYNGGVADGFLMHFDANSGQVKSSTFTGTSGYDQAFLVQADKWGKPYVFGQTSGNTWPHTSKLQVFQGGSQFILKLDETLYTVDKCVTFGSKRDIPDISPSAFLVDKCGRIYISGWGGRVNSIPRGNGGSTLGMPITSNAYDKFTDGSDFYLGVFNRDFDTLLYGTFFGGHTKDANGLPLAEHVDGGTSRFDYEGKVYQSVCAGCGGSSAFPTTPGAHSTKNNSVNCNNAVFKIDFETINNQPKAIGKEINVYATDTVIFDYTAQDIDNYDSLYIMRSGSVFGAPLIPPFAEMPENAGLGSVSSTFKWLPGCQHISNDTYIVVVKVRDNNECPKADTTENIIKITIKMPPAILPPDVVCVAHVDDQTVKISWDQLDENKYFKYYLLYKKDPSGKTEVIDTIYRNSPSEYLDSNTPNHQFQNYCYYLQGVNICDRYGDTSYKACSADEYKKPIDSVYLYSASVVENKSINITWLASKEADFGSYLLFKYTNRFGSGSNPQFYKSINNRKDTTFTDSIVSVGDSSYCYQIRVTDKCGHISNYSNEGCTILLKGESFPYEHRLNWTPYTQWIGGVEKYEIHRSDSIYNLFTYVDQTGSNNKHFSDTTMFYDWGLYTYKIVAKEGFKGLNASSESNWITLHQNPLLWVPEAFTPNGDNINDFWGWVPVYVKDFHIKLYTRWGELIFETNNKKDFFDGKYKDIPYDNNVYIWYAEYTGWDESKHYQSGTLTVLK